MGITFSTARSVLVQSVDVEWGSAMRVTIDLPDDIAAVLESEWNNLPRRSLEAVAVEAYRTGVLTESHVRRLLRFDTRPQVHALLKAHGVPLRYTEADVDSDVSAHRDLGIAPRR